MTAITCTREALNRTISALRQGGEKGEERVVLWLAAASSRQGPLAVVEVYEPDQIADVDYFKLPTESLRALIAHLRAHRLKIAAQVHSHPGDAYHSEADDEWAIVRQVGALSLVLPRFAEETTADNFLDQAVTYELAADNTWVRVPNDGPDGRIGVHQ